MLLIIGATGKIGRNLVAECRSKSIPFRLAVRDQQKARLEFGDDVDSVLFDYDVQNTYAHALSGVDKLFFIAPSPDAPDQVEKLIDVMEDEGVRQMVFSSGRTTGDIPGKPLHQVENLVRQSRIHHTILRPGWFMQNFLNWIGLTVLQEKKFYLPAGDAQTAFVDVRDIAAVACEVLTSECCHGETLELTSEEALSHFEVARKISSVLGRRVRYVPLGEEEYLEKMKSLGWSENTAGKMTDLYRVVKTGKEAEISGDIRKVLGRAPISFDTFLGDYQSEFRERYLEAH